MKHVIAHGALAAIAIGAAFACSSPRSATIDGPLPGVTALTDPLARGRVAFQFHCDRCHPGGEAGLGPALIDKPLPGWLMKIQVRQGLGAMPSIPEEELGDAALDDVVAWIKAVRAGDS